MEDNKRVLRLHNPPRGYCNKKKLTGGFSTNAQYLYLTHNIFLMDKTYNYTHNYYCWHVIINVDNDISHMEL